MKRTLEILVLVLCLAACTAEPMAAPAKEYQSGLLEIQVYYQIPDLQGAFLAGDCVVPTLSAYFVSEVDDFTGYADGWRMVRYEQCVGFAKLR